MNWLHIATAWLAATWIGACIALGMLWRRVAALAAARSASPGREMQSLSSRVGTLESAVEELQPAVEGLLNREKMRRVRTGARVTGEPDPHADPAAWKAHMRRQRALGGSP